MTKSDIDNSKLGIGSLEPGEDSETISFFGKILSKKTFFGHPQTQMHSEGGQIGHDLSLSAPPIHQTISATSFIHSKHDKGPSNLSLATHGTSI